jgi:hypothetical protein
MAKTHPQLESLLAVSGVIVDAAEIAARSAQRQINRALRPRRGQTLRPGVDTPLWNALIQALRAKLTRRGEKVKLGRFLGLPRQRIDDFLIGRRALPDAERTLLLLHWLDAKNRGIDIG